MTLALRSRIPEQMDAAELEPAIYARVLTDLGRANAVTLAARPTLAFLARATAGRDRVRLLDVGFGDGGMLRRIARWAAARGIAAELVGVDLNPKSAAIAEGATDPALGIRYLPGDYAALEGFDVVISSLVAHHMDDAELTAFLRWMEANARIGWFVNDLHRHRVAHLGYPVLAAAFGWHRIVREDGRLSIARAFRPAEWRELLARARVNHARVFRAFPFRLCVERLR
jgi:SAM-dependent methyltransferase